MNLHFGQNMFHDKYARIKTYKKIYNIQRRMLEKMIKVKLILILISSCQFAILIKSKNEHECGLEKRIQFKL